MASPVVSIIIPVFNAVRFIQDCVESVLEQEFMDFELILVDDGSSDGSPEICDMFAGQDVRIRVIHKENGGVSSARNRGLDEARGEYVVFIDSDDYVEPAYLSDMLFEAEKSKSGGRDTLVITDYQPFSEAGPVSRTFPEAFHAALAPCGMTADQFRRLVFGLRLFPPYCKLYRRDILEEHKLRFDTELKSAEDFDFNCRYLRFVEQVWYCPSIRYRYRVDYKKYVPSNHGVLGRSEIKSVHLMANGITEFARRTGLYEKLENEICLWAAKKHYFNRLRMLFAKSGEVGYGERRKLYRALISDAVYRDAAKRGVASLPKSATRHIARYGDCFFVWYLFYSLHQNEIEKD